MFNKTVCLNYGLRHGYSLDFLYCEGFNGWSATHLLSFFTLTLFLGDVRNVWILAGLLEVVEAIVPAIIGLDRLVALGFTSPLSAETVTGAIIGDWFLNDLIGILAAAFLMETFNIPPLLGPWVRKGHVHEAALAKIPAWCSTYFWKQFVFGAVLFASFVLPSWVTPQSCQSKLPYTCTNAGFILCLCIQLLGILFYGVFAMRTKKDQLYLWSTSDASNEDISAFFGLWALYVVLVGFQNTHPAILFIGTQFDEWLQPWLAAAIWILIIAFIRVYKSVKN